VEAANFLEEGLFCYPERSEQREGSEGSRTASRAPDCECARRAKPVPVSSARSAPFLTSVLKSKIPQTSEVDVALLRHPEGSERPRTAPRAFTSFRATAGRHIAGMCLPRYANDA
jgi:hypothetical protein